MSSPVVEGLDVKYTIYSGYDLHLDPDLVQPHVELESRSRRRTGTIQPVIGTENSKLNLHQRDSKGKRAVSTKKPIFVGARKGSSSKKKLSLSRRVGFNGGKKRLSTSSQPAVSPRLGSCDDASPTLEVPREIIFNTSDAMNTPNSGSSKIASNAYDIDCSPLGDEGVESQLIATDSYARMMLTKRERPSVGTSNAECLSPSEKRDASNANRMEWDDTSNILRLQLSPRRQHKNYRRESLISVTPLATGRYPKERCFSFETTRDMTMSCEEPFLGSNEDISVECDNENIRRTDEEMYLSCDKVSLRDVYDQQVKKASRFIGDVVKGYNRTESKTVPLLSNKNLCVENDRLTKFRTLLNDYLYESDGMVEVAGVADKLAKFAETSRDFIFAYTKTEVDLYLKELCAQNKIMQTEGWIYNI
jgi:hypothetical protein